MSQAITPLKNSIKNKLKMKYNLKDFTIPELPEKIIRYNNLHKIYINNNTSKDALDAFNEMNTINNWLKQKGLGIDQSTQLWETYVLSHGTKDDLTFFNQLDADIKKHMLNQDYQALKEISPKRRELLAKLAHNKTEIQFYLTHDILTYIDSFVIRKNKCINYEDLIKKLPKSNNF